MIGVLVAVLIFFGGMMYLDYKTGHNRRLGPSKVGENLPLASKTPPLSAVAQQVLKEYNSLPAESRPFDQIEDILTSLDATLKHLPDFKYHFDSNYHMRASGYSSFNNHKFAWDALVTRRDTTLGPYHTRCEHKDCPYAPYYSLHVEIGKVKKALDDKALALVQSENAHNVNMAQELVNALREEAGIQNKTTARIKEIG